MTSFFLPAGALALVLLSHPVGAEMSDDTPAAALTLEVRELDGMLDIQLIGLSPKAQGVSYTLEVTGQSTSRHRGKTQLAADTRAVLSTMRTTAGENWCVRLMAEEEGRAPYEIIEGPCAA